jgi:hypothetical protein
MSSSTVHPMQSREGWVGGGSRAGGELLPMNNEGGVTKTKPWNAGQRTVQVRISTVVAHSCNCLPLFSLSSAWICRTRTWLACW